MAKRQFIAHRRTTDGEIQELLNHLLEVAKLSRQFSSKLGVPDLGELLGILHDFGKYSRAFQDYIKSATGLLNPDIDDDYVEAMALKGKIDHSSAGAQWVWERYRKIKAVDFPAGKFSSQILALCLVSHHSGLIDCLKLDGKTGFLDRIGKNDAQTHLQECLGVADNEIHQKLAELATTERIKDCLDFLQQINAKEVSSTIRAFRLGLWTRFLYSCLIDTDRIDSADFENPGKKSARNMRPIAWEPAIARLEQYLGNLVIRNDVDIIRRQISQECLTRSGAPQGLYKLTVPTGGGKTYSSYVLRCIMHKSTTWSMSST